MSMTADVSSVKSFILKSDSSRFLLFSILGLHETCQGLDVSDHVLYDGKRAWKCIIQKDIVEELQRKKNANESSVYESSGKFYLQVNEQHLDLEELTNEVKEEVLNLLLFHLAAQNEALNLRASCSNNLLPDVANIPTRKKAKSETLPKTRARMSLVNPVHRKVCASKGVNFN